MKYITLLLFFSPLCLLGQGFNMELISNVTPDIGSNDVWGFEHENGIEYAILGTRSSAKVYSLEDPENPVEIFDAPGFTTIWRDMKNFGNYVYVTTDGAAGGLGIIDMNDVSDIQFTVYQPMIPGQDVLGDCHNIYIDEKGYAYLAGCNVSNAGVAIFDLNADPMSPPFVGEANLAYSHDVFVRDDILYSSEIFDGQVGIYDVQDRTAPVLLATQATTSNFTHNAWPSDDDNYLFTTDERGEAFLDAYDISDLGDIKLLDSWRPVEFDGEGIVPHNTHYLDGYLVTSWYTQGVIVIDAHKPDNLIKIASYNTWVGSQGGTNGCWGAFPFLPSGLMLASDRADGLFVFQPNFQRACYLEGFITDAATGDPITGATINIISDEYTETNSDASGNYKTGLATSGTYEVEVSKVGYDTVIVQADLINGEVTSLDVQLGNQAGEFTGNVIKALDGSAVANAKVIVIGPGGTQYIDADDEGNFTMLLLEGTYEIFAGAWGYISNSIEYDSATDPLITIELEEGYYDEFFFDYEWVKAGSTSGGFWTRAEPNQNINMNADGQAIQPLVDNADDFGSEALVTGNGVSFDMSEDYVQGGVTRITTPVMDLSGYDHPLIRFDYWFYNKNQTQVIGDQYLEVRMGDGSSSRVLGQLTDTNSEFINYSVDPSTYFSDLSNLKLTFSVENQSTDPDGEIVEAAIDVFEVYEGEALSVDHGLKDDFLVYPNPFSDEFFIQQKGNENMQYKVMDLYGKIIMSGNSDQSELKLSSSNLTSGMYLINISTDGTKNQSFKLIKE